MKVYEDERKVERKTYSKQVWKTGPRGYNRTTTYYRDLETGSKYRRGSVSPRNAKGLLVLRPNSYLKLYHSRSIGKSTTTTRWSEAYSGRIESSRIDQLHQNSYASYDANYILQLRDASAKRFLDKIYDVDFSAAQFLIERKQAYNLIANRAMQLGRLFLSLKRGRNPFKNGRKCRSKDAANLWLEYSYGWVPLVSDVYAIMELQKLEPPPFMMSAHEKGSSESVNETVVSAGGGTSTRIDRKILSNARVTHTARVRLVNTELDFINKLGLTNPASLAWELLPYSFVVDWFVPVGDWLKYQATPKAITTDQISRTTTFQATQVITVTGNQSGNSYLSKSFSGYSTRAELDFKERTLLSSLPYPPLKLNMPGDYRQGLSALALLRQRFN